MVTLRELWAEQRVEKADGQTKRGDTIRQPTPVTLLGDTQVGCVPLISN